MQTVMWTCHRCTREKVKVSVRDKSDGEDIVAYTKEIAGDCGVSHSILSPNCPERKIDLYLPMTQSGIAVDGEPLSAEDLKELKEKHGI